MERHTFFASLSVSTEEFLSVWTDVSHFCYYAVFHFANCLSRDWYEQVNTVCTTRTFCITVLLVITPFERQAWMYVQVGMTGRIMFLLRAFWRRDVAARGRDRRVATEPTGLRVVQQRRIFCFILSFSCSNSFWICIWNGVKRLFIICCSLDRRIFLSSVLQIGISIMITT